MNAPSKIDARQVVSAFPSWGERWDAFKGTGYWREALLSIAEDASAQTIHQDNELATYAYDAATVAAADERAEFIGEVERIFAEYRAVEAREHRAYCLERNPNHPLERAMMEAGE